LRPRAVASRIDRKDWERHTAEAVVSRNGPCHQQGWMSRREPARRAWRSPGQARSKPLRISAEGFPISGWRLNGCGRLVLPRGIEPPTPSLPRTCSTPELRQRTLRLRKAGGTCHRAHGIASAMTQPAKAWNWPDFPRLFHGLAKIWSRVRHRRGLLRGRAVGWGDSHDEA
jgi:hypothetical protein